MRRPTLADGGFQHISDPASRVVDQVVEAVIRRVQGAGDAGRAARLQRIMRDFRESANAP